MQYPVGRAGSRFEALVPSATLATLDTSRLLFFVLQDDAGHRYPAMIDEVVPAAEAELTLIRGVVVAHG